MIIFLIINLQKNILNLWKWKIIIKINPTHLIEIEKTKLKNKQLKIQKNNGKIIIIATKIQHNYF